MTNIIKNNMQIAYDNLIELANMAYESSQNPVLKGSGLTGEWIGKADAYEYAAHTVYTRLLLSGILLESRVTERRKDIEIARHEDCAADAEIENEPEEIRENQPY